MGQIDSSMSPASRHSFEHTVEICGLVFAAGVILNVLAGWNWGITLMVAAVVITVASWRNIHANGEMPGESSTQVTAPRRANPR